LLSKRNGIYYFRVAIPLDLRKLFAGQSEIKKSLKTINRKEAKVSASHFQYQFESLFYKARCGMLTDDQIKSVRSIIIGECIEDLHNGVPFATSKSEPDPDRFVYTKDDVLNALDNESNYFSEMQDEFYALANASDNLTFHPYVVKQASYLARELKLPVEISPRKHRNYDFISIDDSSLSLSFRQLCEIIQSTLKTVCSVEVERLLDSDTSADTIRMYKDGLPSPTISELWDAYYKDKTLRNEWRSRTSEKYVASFKTVLDIIGDIKLEQLDSRTAHDLIDGLKHYPKNKNKIKQFREKPFSKSMAKMSDFKPLTDKSINFTIGMMSGLLKFALEDRRRWKIEGNPFYKKQIKELNQREQHENRRAFTTDELIIIISELSKVNRVYRPEYFWVPLICLYSGMRINEACQLRLNDIEELNHIPVFRIRHNLEYFQETKNEKDRTVPIHNVLQNLGFLEYVAWQRSLNEERLFPKLKLYKGKWHKRVDDWFNRTVLRSHLKLKGEATFHSTKHTFLNWFKQKGEMEFAELSMLKAIAAHFDNRNMTEGFDDGGITTNLYGKPYDIEKLYDFINKLNYKIDLSSLKMNTDSK